VKTYVYLIISIVTILRYSTNEAAKCCPNSLDIVFLSSHCKSVLLSPIRSMLSLFSVPFHLVLYQMHFLSLLFTFIYFSVHIFPIPSFTILFLIVSSSFCKSIFSCFHNRSSFYIFCLNISTYYIRFVMLFISVLYRYFGCHPIRIIIIIIMFRKDYV